MKTLITLTAAIVLAGSSIAWADMPMVEGCPLSQYPCDDRSSTMSSDGTPTHGKVWDGAFWFHVGDPLPSAEAGEPINDVDTGEPPESVE